MKKRILAFLLTAMMVMGTLVLTVGAAATRDTNMVVSVDQVEVEKDATSVTVALWITGITDEDDLGAISFCVAYDDTKLRMTDIYAETGSGRNKTYYGAASFEGGYQLPSLTQNPFMLNAWTTAFENPCYDSIYEMNTYEFAFAEFEILGDWEGRTPLEISLPMFQDRPNDTPYIGYTIIDGYIQRGEYNEEPDVTNTLTVGAEGVGTVDATIAGTTTSDITAATEFAPAIGDAVKLEAKGEGFKYWKNALSGAIVSEDAILEWTDAGSVRNLVAVFADDVAETYTVTFKDNLTGKIFKIMDVAAGYALTASDLPAAPSMLGYTFKGFKADDIGGKMQNAEGYVINEDTLIRSCYEKDNTTTYTLGVNANGKNYSYQRSFAAIGTVTCTDANFSYWTDENGTVVSLDPVYKFIMPKNDITLTAVCGANDTPDTVLAFVENTLDNNQIVTTITRDLKDGYTLVEAGILYTRKATEADLVVPKTVNTVTQGISTAAADEDVFAFAKDVTGKTGTWLVRGYMVYRDASGALNTVYTTVDSIVVA